MIDDLAFKIQSFSKCYQESVKIWHMNLGFPEDLTLIKNNAYQAIRYLTTIFHERAGANPNFPRYHRIAIQRALNRRRFSDAVIHDADYPSRVWSEFEKLANEKPNEKLTKGVVKDLLEKLREEKQPNIIKLLGSMKLRDASDFLRRLNGIGPKLSAFILRDLHWLFKLWTDELRDDPMKYYLLQPIDRWVRRISELCWPSLDLRNNHDRAAKQIVKKCRESGVDPIRFNQGAWFIGRYFNKLLTFHELPEQPLNIDVIKRFEADRVLKGITNFKRFMSEKLIFIV